MPRLLSSADARRVALPFEHKARVHERSLLYIHTMYVCMYRERVTFNVITNVILAYKYHFSINSNIINRMENSHLRNTWRIGDSL